MIAIGIPVVDIGLSFGVLHELYYVTIYIFWIAIDFIWKLVTCALIFPKVITTGMATALAAAGALMHIAYELPVSYMENINKESVDTTGYKVYIP